MYIFLAFLAPLFFSISILIESHLVNNIFKNKFTLLALSGILNLVFLPIILLIGTPHLFDINLLWAFLLIAFLEVFYLLPYFKALEYDDSSSVASFFTLGKIIIPILSYFIAKETLNLQQYFGFIIIIISTFSLSFFKLNGKIKLNKSVLYMIISSLLTSLSAVIWKYIFNSIDFITGFFWVSLFTFFINISFFISKKIRIDAKKNYNLFLLNFKFFFLNELAIFIGTITSNYAVSLGSVSVVKAISSISAFYILFLTLIFHKFSPHLFKENITLKSIYKKSFWFIFIIIGTFLILN
ncbi:MAG: EamA family transporter [Candidatus Gracilibacteria bacterium]|nr:EamA family transporter [Candidatus Gracilibacteria bacterium]